MILRKQQKTFYKFIQAAIFNLLFCNLLIKVMGFHSSNFMLICYVILLLLYIRGFGALFLKSICNYEVLILASYTTNNVTKLTFFTSALLNIVLHDTF